jgi:hypothetical protein
MRKVYKSLFYNLNMSLLINLLQIFILLLSLGTFIYCFKKNKSLFRRFYFIFIGIFLFEFSTQLMWVNNNLWSFTYLGPDLNWVITLGWTCIVFYSIMIANTYFVHVKKSKMFFITLGIITFISLLAETLVVKLGIREYGVDVQNTISGILIPVLGIPVEALFFIPVFISLVLGFVKYFEIIGYKKIRDVKVIHTKIKKVKVGGHEK